MMLGSYYHSGIKHSGINSPSIQICYRSFLRPEILKLSRYVIVVNVVYVTMC